MDLDDLLILLKEDLTLRWYEFGLVVGAPMELMNSYSGYPSDQCLTEILDYWLRHHFNQLTWTEVAQALKAIELDQLAEKVLLQMSSITLSARKLVASLLVKTEYMQLYNL